MMFTSGLALCISGQKLSKRYTCKKGKGLGSINDFIMVSTDLEGNNGQVTTAKQHHFADNRIATVQESVTVHPTGHCGSDHRIVTHQMKVGIQSFTNDWGINQPEKYDLTGENINKYRKAIDESTEISALIKQCKEAINSHKKRTAQGNERDQNTHESVAEKITSMIKIILKLAKVAQCTRQPQANAKQKKRKRQSDPERSQMQNRPKQNDPRRANLWELREQRERILVKVAYDEMNQEEKEKNETHIREIQAEIQSLHNAIEKTEADRYCIGTK